MRACGNCGESGHNQRTCKKGNVMTAEAPAPVRDPFVVKRSDVAVAFVVKDQESIARNARLVAKSSTPKGIGDDLDEETKEAIDWYMEKNYPGYLKRKKERERNGPRAEESDDESDA